MDVYPAFFVNIFQGDRPIFEMSDVDAFLSPFPEFVWKLTFFVFLMFGTLHDMEYF